MEDKRIKKIIKKLSGKLGIPIKCIPDDRWEDWWDLEFDFKGKKEKEIEKIKERAHYLITGNMVHDTLVCPEEVGSDKDSSYMIGISSSGYIVIQPRRKTISKLDVPIRPPIVFKSPNDNMNNETS